METEKKLLTTRAEIITKRNKWIRLLGLILGLQVVLVWVIVRHAYESADFFQLILFPALLGVFIVGVVGYFKLFRLWRAVKYSGHKVSLFILKILLLLSVTAYAWSIWLANFLQQWYPPAPFGGM